VAAPDFAAISATAGQVTQTAVLNVNPAPGAVSLAALTLSATSVSGGNTVTGTVTLNAAAPAGGAAVALSSADATVATVPASVTVPAGATTATFAVTAQTVAFPVSVRISGSFGGPLIKKKLFFSEVFKYDMKKISVRGLPWPYDITKRQGFNSFTTLEAILSDHQVMTLTVNAFPQRVRYADINALVPEPASNDLSQSGVAVYLADKYQFDSGAVLSAIAQYTRFDSTGHGQGYDDMLVTPEGWGGNFFNRWSRRGKEFQFVPTYQFSEKDFWGRHQIRAGVDVDHRAYTGTNSLSVAITQRSAARSVPVSSASPPIPRPFHTS